MLVKFRIGTDGTKLAAVGSRKSRTTHVEIHDLSQMFGLRLFDTVCGWVQIVHYCIQGEVCRIACVSVWAS